MLNNQTVKLAQKLKTFGSTILQQNIWDYIKDLQQGSNSSHFDVI